jgi:hypothetical protein
MVEPFKFEVDTPPAFMVVKLVFVVPRKSEDIFFFRVLF